MTRPSTLLWCAAFFSLTTVAWTNGGVAQGVSRRSVPTRTTPSSPPPTPETAYSQRYLDSVYARLLERTNQQLSLWWNPYGVMVASLGALFAVLAIVAAVIIFRQSREYRSLLTGAVAEYQGILNAFIAEKNEKIERQSTDLTEKIDQLTKDLATAGGAQKKQIQAEMAELQKLKKSLKPYEQPKFSVPGSLGYSIGLTPNPLALSTVFTPSSGLSFGPYFAMPGLIGSRACAKCGKTYNPPAPEPGTVVIGGRPVACPHCGNVERV